MSYSHSDVGERRLEEEEEEEEEEGTCMIPQQACRVVCEAGLVNDDWTECIKYLVVALRIQRMLMMSPYAYAGYKHRKPLCTSSRP